MNETERQLLATLVELEAAAKATPRTPGRSGVGPLLARLEGLARELPPGTDPALLHYLRQKSYQKARLWLEGLGAENNAGTCGR